MNNTAYKKMSSHGSISIPVAMRRSLGLQPRDPMVVDEENGVITIRPYTQRCVFCGSQDDVVKVRGKGICPVCIGLAEESAGGGNDAGE